MSFPTHDTRLTSSDTVLRIVEHRLYSKRDRARSWSSALRRVTTLMRRERTPAKGMWQVSRDAAKQTVDTRREVIEVSWTSAFVLSLATKSIPGSVSRLTDRPGEKRHLFPEKAGKQAVHVDSRSCRGYNSTALQINVGVTRFEAC